MSVKIGILASSRGATAPPVGLLLDTYPGAAVAYSLRKLRTAYTGAAIRVQKILNTSQTDIGFNSSGGLDTTALLNFCGTDGCTIEIWYDQSGNGRNAIATLTTARPLLVISGVIQTINGKPTALFDANRSMELLVSSNFWTYTGDSTLFHVSVNNHTSYQSVFSYNEGINTSLGIQYTKFPSTATNVSTDIYAPGGLATNLTQSQNVQYLVAMKWQNWSTSKTNGNTIIAINGLNQAISPYGGNPSPWANNGKCRVGAFDTFGTWNGKLQEIVIYTSAFTQTNIDGAESNINTYYTIY